MHAAKTAIGGFIAGAGFMYLADPNRGKRRRAIARDKAGACWRDAATELDKAGRDLSNRSHGLTAAVQSIWRRSDAAGPLLEARVRSKIGRVVSHPHAIRAVADGSSRIVLEGDILRDEVSHLLKAVRAMPGVKEVVNRLECHQEAANIANLQGGVKRLSSPEILQENWTPSLRIGAALAAGLGFVASLRARGVMGLAGVAASAAVLARAVANKSFVRLFGMNGDCIVHFEKTVRILAPIGEVFDFWSHVENFPRFMTHLKEVRDLGNKRSHWVAAGPGGVSIPWDAEITESETNCLLAWRSVPGSLVRTRGRVRFEDDVLCGTRITPRMSYCPPAGVVGHTVACLFVADPKSEIDDDMVRLKSLLEIGKTRAHGTTVWREQIPVPTGG